MAGAVLIGAASSRAKARGYPAILVPLLCGAGLLLAQLGLALRPQAAPAVTLLWALFAFCAAGGASGYVAIGQMFPTEQVGRVATATNTLTLAGAFLLQAAIGWILDLWPSTAQGGWDPRGYSAALLLSAGIQLLVTVQSMRLGWRAKSQ
jgi:hypothetical protein